MLSPGPHVLSQSSTNPASTTDSSTTPTTPAKRKTYVAISLTSTSTTYGFGCYWRLVSFQSCFDSPMPVL
ncbi:hypothetical protein B0H14DRAFT_3508395 [Mycena olivaceomarginata]|nr:hypothetical protein B0H14DRAFT_3508395 [Mycena olivaceomarginata]